MALRGHYECRLKDGKLLNFDGRANDFTITNSMIVFMALNPETNTKIILSGYNIDEVSYFSHEFPDDWYQDIMNQKATDTKIEIPNKKIITP